MPPFTRVQALATDSLGRLHVLDNYAAAAVILEKADGKVASASIAMTNLSDTPVFSADAAAALVGTDCGADAMADAVTAMLGDIDPTEDNRGPVEFKKHVAGVILRRAIERAWSRA